MTSRYRPNEPACPVPLELLSLLLRSSDDRIVSVIGELPMLHRATLAAYCNGRCHMRRIALVIAAECTEASLYEVAGSAGLTLYDQSQGQFEIDESVSRGRRRVSLARSA